MPSAHLKLDDETVSRMHAIIEVNGPGDVSIIDLGSTKGTFVNGQKVNKAKLQSGDTIVVGETRIELAIGAGEEDEPTTGQHAVAAPAPRGASSLDAAPAASPPSPAAPPHGAADARAPRRARGRRRPAGVRAAARAVVRSPLASAAGGARRSSAARACAGGAPLYGTRDGAVRWASSRRWPSEAMTSVARAPSRSPRCSATRSSA